MERVSQSLIFLTREQIIQVNFELITRYGGFFMGKDNLRCPGSLDWVLVAIQYPIFNVDQYPSIAQKGAILSWIINEGHVFNDGNKRTSTFAFLLFLRLNHYSVNATQEELLEISERIAKNKTCSYSYDDYASWVKNKLIQKI